MLPQRLGIEYNEADTHPPDHTKSIVVWKMLTRDFSVQLHQLSARDAEHEGELLLALIEYEVPLQR
jgi:hypothetical protein